MPRIVASSTRSESPVLCWLLRAAAVASLREVRRGRGEGAGAACRAANRARPREGRGGGVCAGFARVAAGPADAGGSRLCHHDLGAAGDGGLVPLLGSDPGGDGVDQRLLEGLLLPAGGGGLRLLVGQRPRCEERAGAGEGRGG